MARAKKIPGIDADTEFREAGARAVEVRSGEFFSFQRGVLDTADIERVHAMRVASRRLRAVLEVFAPCFPRRAHAQALKEVKALADVLGERRDPDVAIEGLARIAAGLTAADRPGIRGLIAEFEEGQRTGNERLARALEEIQERGLRARLLALAEAARAE